MTRRTNTGWRMARAGLFALAITLAMVGCGQPAEEATAGHLIFLTPTPIGDNDFLKLGRVGTERAAASLGMTYETREASTTRAAELTWSRQWRATPTSSS